MSGNSQHFDPSTLFPRIGLGIYRLIFQPLTNFKEKKHSGSAWHGAMGWPLRDTCCPYDQPFCNFCSFIDRCPWYLFFAEETDFLEHKDPPRPYTLFPHFTENGMPCVQLTLVGPALYHLTTLFEALESGAWKGISGQNGINRYRLTAVEQYLPGIGWQPWYAGEAAEVSTVGDFLTMDDVSHPPPWSFRISCLSLRKEKKDLLQADWGHAFSTLAIRLDVLHRLCGAERMAKTAWLELKPFLSNPGQITDRTSPDYWQRQSSTQNGKIHNMVGVSGMITIWPPPENEEIWWRWWRVAELVSVGKHTTMGNGWVQFVPNI